MKNSRLMALDFGDVRIGIAFSDPLKTIAFPYQTYKRVQEKKDITFLSNLAKEKEVEKVIVGLPLNMDGTEGYRAKKTRMFGNKFQKFSNIKVEYVDERLTSVEAEDLLIESGMRREKRKDVIDKLAASLILESYLRKIDMEGKNGKKE